MTVSCCEGEAGRAYEGILPIARQELSFSAAAAEEDASGGPRPPPRTGVMIILANPDKALQLAALPVAGVGLARLEFIIARIGTPIILQIRSEFLLTLRSRSRT